MDFKMTSKLVNLPRPYGTRLVVAVKVVPAIATALTVPLLVVVVMDHVLLVMPW